MNRLWHMFVAELQTEKGSWLLFRCKNSQVSFGKRSFVYPPSCGLTAQLRHGFKGLDEICQ
jgi:hypothetical protein